MYYTEVFGLYPEGSGEPEKIIKQGSDRIRFFFDKDNSGHSVLSGEEKLQRDQLKGLCFFRQGARRACVGRNSGEERMPLHLPK